MCQDRYDSLHDLDICSPVFNQKRAVTIVMEHPDRMVCDVLLDQDILPGVGNIIKNEVSFTLFLIQIHSLKSMVCFNDTRTCQSLYQVKASADY